MVSNIDKEIYYRMSFNEQMAWIDEEVERINRHNEKYDIKRTIQEMGRDMYGQDGYTNAISRLFEIIKSDPKNRALLHEVYNAEKQLLAYLYDEPSALSEVEIYGYWNSYLQSYIAELAAHPMHYVLVKGAGAMNGKEDKNCEVLGIYDSKAKLQEVYERVLPKLQEQQNEKLIINVFDEFTECWSYNVEPEQLFMKEKSYKDDTKIVECVIDSADMCLFKIDKIKKSLTGYVYEDDSARYGRHGQEVLNVRFEVDYSYQALGLFDWYWGNWNGTCPDSQTMKEKAKEWYEKYDAEIQRISHDTLTFKCRKLSEIEAMNIINEAEQFNALIIDCEKDELIKHLMEKETFTIWWD